MYINGEFVEAHGGAYFPVYDPSTEEIIAEVPEADEKDVDRAVAAAKAAFDSGAWPQTTAQDRGRILFRLAERIRKEARARSPISSAAIPASPSSRRSTTSPTSPPASNITAALATKVLGHVNPVPDNALSLSRCGTHRRRRADYSLELSAADGGMETRAGHRRGLHAAF